MYPRINLLIFNTFLSNFIAKAKNLIMGQHPNTRIFHPQHVVSKNLNDLVGEGFIQKYELLNIYNILDVGCGNKPYSFNLPRTLWFGIDILSGENVDLVISDSGLWELPENSFDAVICTEVLEHALHPAVLVGEMLRVMKPGALALVSTPFLYGVHGQPHDFRRYTDFGLRLELERLQVIESGLLGGVGSVLGLTANNWMLETLAPHKFLRIFFAPLFWIFCLLNNVGAMVLDRLDRTGNFATNSWAIVRKQ
jgi:SAM-dependent methyltransferase